MNGDYSFIGLRSKLFNNDELLDIFTDILEAGRRIYEKNKGEYPQQLLCTESEVFTDRMLYSLFQVIYTVGIASDIYREDHLLLSFGSDDFQAKYAVIALAARIIDPNMIVTIADIVPVKGRRI